MDDVHISEAYSNYIGSLKRKTPCRLSEIEKAILWHEKSKDDDVDHVAVESRVALPLSVDIGAKKVYYGETEISIPAWPDYGYLNNLKKKVKSLKLVTDDNLVNEEKLLTFVRDTTGITTGSTDWRVSRVARTANLPQKDLADAKTCGEMYLQQVVYSPIAELFSCFNISLYCADIKVDCAHVVGCKNNIGTMYQVSCQPDAALRLTEDFYVCAMMEIKAYKQSQEHDEYKSVLMTCMSILALQESLLENNLFYEKAEGGDDDSFFENDTMISDTKGFKDDCASQPANEECKAPVTKKTKLASGKSSSHGVKFGYGNLAVPFVLAKHDEAILYVTQVLGKGKSPTVSKLMTITFTNKTEVETKEKSEFMAILTILVAEIFAITIKLRDMNHFLKNIKKGQTSLPLNNALSPTKSSNSKMIDSKTSGSGSYHGSEEHTQHFANPRERENAAMQLASKNGLVQKLTFPFPRIKKLYLDDEIHHCSDQWVADMKFYQQESPFYFRGLYHSKDVFCKVWQEGDSRTDRKNVMDEMKFHCMANNQGVPSTMVISDLTAVDLKFSIPQDKSSAVYHVLATEYHKRDVVSEQDVLKFALKLVQAVQMLHRIGILHCDIKPSNVLWDSDEKIVRLIDFGHAQLALNSRNYPTTKYYEAPEISKKHPHNEMSDAYGVGRTLQEISKDFKSLDSEIVRKLAAFLQLDSSMRMSLEQADSWLVTMGNDKSGSEGNCNLESNAIGQSLIKAENALI